MKALTLKLRKLWERALGPIENSQIRPPSTSIGSWLSPFSRARVIQRESSLRLLKIIALIFFSEFTIMALLPFLDIKNPWLETLVDVLFLSLTSAPMIWIFVINPDRQKLLNEIENSSDTFISLINSLGEHAIISVTDLNGRILFANETFCQISGYNADELIGKDHRVLNSGHHSKPFFQFFWNSILEGKVWSGDVCNRKKNGESYWVQSLVIPLYDHQKKIHQFLSVQIDITAQKRAHEIIERESLQEVHRDRMSFLGEMAGSIAHEVNNPLSVINGMLINLEMLLASKINDEAIKLKAMDRIFKSKLQIQRITKIISGLREFSRSDQNPSTEFVSLNHIMDVVQILISDRLKQSQIGFEFFGAPEIRFKANQVQIEQVLVNLITNAADAIEAQNPKWIKVVASQQSGKIEIRVMDSGHGVPEDLRKKIMTPFFTTKAIGKGTGIGLSISKGIVESHKGTLQLDSSSENTTFVIQIPIDPENPLQSFDFDGAIQSHMAWRQTFTQRLQFGSSEKFDIPQIQSPHQCRLGQWLKELAEGRTSRDPLWAELQSAHSRFHQLAAEIAEKFNDKKVDVRATLFDSGSEFDLVSQQVIYLIDQIRQKGLIQEKKSS